MIYLLPVLALLIAGCNRDQAPTASTTPDVAAVRGGTGPTSSGPSNYVTETVGQGVTTMKKAQAEADAANKRTADQVRAADNVAE